MKYQQTNLCMPLTALTQWGHIDWSSSILIDDVNPCHCQNRLILVSFFFLWCNYLFGQMEDMCILTLSASSHICWQQADFLFQHVWIDARGRECCEWWHSTPNLNQGPLEYPTCKHEASQGKSEASVAVSCFLSVFMLSVLGQTIHSVQMWRHLLHLFIIEYSTLRKVLFRLPDKIRFRAHLAHLTVWLFWCLNADKPHKMWFLLNRL